jgi:ribonuclease HII
MEETLNTIKLKLEHADIEQIEELLSRYETDPRAGVQKLVVRFRKKKKDFLAEKERTSQMFVYERKYSAYQRICGIDEAGRGPLAGPVVAAAVILDPEKEILYLNDSKQLSEKKREVLYDEIMEKAACVSVGMAGWERIDEINILQADFEAMREALQKMPMQPDLLLNDAVTIPDVSIRQIPIVHGDALSASIAAASIIAKVTRDRIMADYDKRYPEYGFASHKGYGTKAHIQALQQYGPSPIHRKSFLKNFGF